MDSTSSAQGHRNAPSPRGGAVLVSIYSWACITLGVTIARFVIGWIHKVKFGLDDGMILGGSIVYTGATISWQFAVNGGLGKHFSEVSRDDAATYFKASYAAQVLQIVAMATAKLSSAFLVSRVAPQTCLQNTVLFGTVGLWTVYSLFVFAFQCGLPRPWRLNAAKCAHGGPLISIIAFNMISDVVLSVWIIPILRPLNMDKERRTTVGILFGSRAVVALVAIVQIWSAVKAVGTQDPTWESYQLALLNQAVTSLSLIVASLPRIKRFLGVADSGLAIPVIHETEIALSTREASRTASRAGNELRLIPSNSNQFTTTIISDRSKRKEKNKAQQEWEKLVSMNSTQDEHTSASSLFDRGDDSTRQGGVMRQQEVTVKVEAGNRRD